MIELGRHSVLGVGIDAVDYETAVSRICTAVEEGYSLGVSALAVHGVMTGVQDPEHLYRLNQLELVVPDGQPVRWALKWLYRIRLPDRVYGPNLTLKTCEMAAEKNLAVYLYGSSESVLKKFRKNLQTAYPSLRISGAEPSKFRNLTFEEMNETMDRIKQCGSQIVLVGLGCPRQEVWVYENREILSMPVLAVGAAFDFHAGTLTQAPAWMQRAGLEWFYRLCKEPKRLWKRYLLLNPLFLWGILRQKLGNVPVNEGKAPKEKKNYG